MPKFGIFSDIMGVREDVPYIKMNKAYSPESENVYLFHGEGRRIRARLKEFLDSSSDLVKTPDTNPVIRYHTHKTSTGTEYPFVATKAHIYLWSTASKSFTTMFTCSSNCTHWSIVSFNGKVVATNNVDLVQVWSDATAGTGFVALDSTTKGLDTDGGTTYVTAAKYVFVYENYIHIGFTTEGGVTYPYRDRWCSRGDETDWQSTSGSGDAGYKDFIGRDYIKGYGHYDFQGANQLVVFKDKSWYFMWLTTEDTVFETAAGSNKIGLLATDSVVNDKEGNLYYYASDYTIRKLTVGAISQGVDTTVRGVSPTYQDYITAAFLDEYNHLCWSIPKGGGSTGNDKLISYDVNYKTWHPHDIAVRAFGEYSRQTVWTIDTLPDSTIDGITTIKTIDSVENIVGWPLELCSDYSGYTYVIHADEQDNAADFTGKLVLSTDLTNKQSLGEYKRINGMWLFFNSEPNTEYTVSVAMKEEDDDSWQSLGSVALDGTGAVVRKWLTCDLRSRDFLQRFTATNKFSFLGVIFHYEFDGDR